MATKEKEVVNIVKSENDKREYKYIVLKNKLRLLLISDPTTEKSAASVCVNVGHSSDPVAVPGIANFFEYLPYLGTEKYPVNNEFYKFLSQKGGGLKTRTNVQHTNCSFEVRSEFFYPALDRFAQFFISPLFERKFIKEVLDKIDSDHQKIIYQNAPLFNYIQGVTSKPGHVQQKLGLVHLKTLNTVLKEKNIDIRKLLLNFHTQFYSSNITTVCILGRDTIEEIEKCAVPLFGQLKNKNVIVPECKEFPYGDEETKIIIKLATFTEMENFELKFTIPDYRDHYSSKPEFYLSYLIGQKGKGSLFSMLKKKTWVNAFSCGCSRSLKGYDFFDIKMALSEEGMTHIDEIVDLCFMYINMLREKAELWIFNEIKMLVDIKFRFQNEVTMMLPLTYVTNLTDSMHLYEPEDVLYGDFKYETFSPDLIKEVLSYLIPSNMRIMLTSEKFKGLDLYVDSFYAEYSIEKIPKERIEKLTQIGTHPEFHLPEKNIFIPQTLDVVVDKREKDDKSIPTMIKNNSLMRVWYKADDTFLPNSTLEIQVSSPNACSTPLHANLLMLFTFFVSKRLAKFDYDAKSAGMEYNIGWTFTGFEISITGYNSSQLVLLKIILDIISDLKVDEEMFEENKEELEDELKKSKNVPKNFSKHSEFYLACETGFDLCRQHEVDNFLEFADDKYDVSLQYLELYETYSSTDIVRTHVVSEKHWSPEETLECIGDVTISRFKVFITEFFQQIFIECLMCGNLLVENVNEMCDVIEEKLIKDKNVRPMLPTQHMLVREHKLPNASNYLYEKRSKIRSKSCIQVYFQAGLREEKSDILCQLFAEMVAVPFFQRLKTKEKLGYTVFRSNLRSSSVQGVLAFIESDKPPSVVEERIESFFEKYEKKLKKMPDKQFRDYIDALVKKKLNIATPKSIGQKSTLYWIEIVNKIYHFQRQVDEIKSLKKITKDDVLKFFKKYIAPSSNERKRLVIVILGKDAKALSKANKSFQMIDNVSQFKCSLPLYPYVTPFIDVPLIV